METVPLSTLLPLAVSLIFLNAFFVATEFSLVKVRRTRLDELASAGNRSAVRTREMVRHTDQYLSACQLGITLASLALGWVGEPAFARLIEWPLTAIGLGHLALIHTVASVFAFLTITCLHVVLGELAPKSLAIQYSEPVSMAISWPMSFFYRSTFPFINFLNWAGNATLRLAGLPPPDEGVQAHSANELRFLMVESQRSGELSIDDRVLLENALDFSAHSVRQIMRPRGEILHLSTNDPVEQTYRRILDTGYTRYPLCRGDLDHVVGLIHVRDLLGPGRELQTLDQLELIKREILFVPELIKIGDVLRLMRKKKVLMAIAVDEYGVVAGLVTMEDILERLVGEIQDEFDLESPAIRQTKDGAFLVEGTVLLKDVNRRLMLDLHSDSAETISGHLLSLLGRMAVVGEVVELDHYQVRVVEVKGLRIARVLFTPQSSGRSGADGPSPD